MLLETPELLLRPILLFLVDHQVWADPLCVSELMPSTGYMPRLCANKEILQLELTFKEILDLDLVEPPF